MQAKFQKYIDIARSLKDKPNTDHLHFSFISKKNRILAIGWNSKKTNPKALKYGYPWCFVHSELSAILRFDGKIKELLHCSLINVRINRQGEIGYSKPCKYCLNMLKVFKFRNVYFSSKSGDFAKLETK